MQSVPITTKVETCGRSVVISEYSGFLHQYKRRYDITKILLKVVPECVFRIIIRCQQVARMQDFKHFTLVLCNVP